MVRALPSHARLPLPGERVGRYEVLAPIAEGGMAAVFVARAARDGDAHVALKILLPHLRGEDGFIDMFLDEARIAAQIEHPNVVRVLELGAAGDTPFMVMEYLRGCTLRELLRRATPAPRDAVLLHVLARAAAGLHAAHEARAASGEPLGIVHRDVSPQNIHVGFDGRVTLLDFGIAAARGRITETKSGEIKGKFQYAAPEQITREVTLDRRVDLWALGVVAHEALTGIKPFRGEDDATTLWNVMNKEIEPLRRLRPELPPPVLDVLERALRRDREARPATAAEMAAAFEHASRDVGAADLAALVRQCTPEPLEAPLAPRAAPRRRIWGLAVGLIAVSLVAGVVLAGSLRTAEPGRAVARPPRVEPPAGATRPIETAADAPEVIAPAPAASPLPAAEPERDAPSRPRRSRPRDRSPLLENPY